MRCSIVPPYLLLRIARLNNPRLAVASIAARKALIHDGPFRSDRDGVRHEPLSATHRDIRSGSCPLRTIFDAEHTQSLPGHVVREEGAPATDDPAANEAYNGLGYTHELYRAAYSWASVDGHNLPLLATVHYGHDYDNAFWNGSRMVFGDGDGQVFTRFTGSLSVIGHELTHGLTQYTANLVYRNQSGALNESVSDVFGALVEQYARHEATDAASWLIGEGLFTDQVEGNALRSLKAPGTAYDDDVLGTDPQPDHMTGYIQTEDDNGGVHLNSGIPNHAFYLVAKALGGNAWERAGHIWFDTLTGGLLSANSSFAQFADATTAAAARRYGGDSVEQRAVADAWHDVGVLA